MADLVNTGNKNTLLDNNLLISSESTPAQRVLVVNPTTNRVAINKTTPVVELDVVGSTAISSLLNVQGSKLVVNASGRVGINVVPSGLYQFEVSGDTMIVGSITVTGTITGSTTSNLDIQDSNITLNKGGTDLSASGAGITVDRNPSADALLTWNNTKVNFEAGVVGNISSLIRAGGNSDAAAITIGTSDAFDFNLKTNNTNRIQIASAGGVSIISTLAVTASADIFIKRTAGTPAVSVRNGLVPPGTIISFVAGTFSASANVGFSSAVVGGNDATAVNTWLANNGYSNWKVCDGQPYTIPGSLLYSATRNVPDLDDERFLAGSTASATSGGLNGFSHTHTFTTALNSGLSLTHTHTTDAQAGISAESAVLENYTSTVGSCTMNTNSAGHAPAFHSHSLGAHTHDDGGLGGKFLGNGRDLYVDYAPSDCINWLISVGQSGSSGGVVTDGATGHSTNLFIDGTSGATGTTTTSSSPSSPSAYDTTSHTHTYNHTHPFTHGHSVTTPSHDHSPTPHTHTLPSTVIPIAQFSHDHGTSGASSVSENRPQYLTCFYLVRVK